MAITLACAASSASAQHNVRDAAAFPCRTHERLSVMQDQQGFSITNTKPEKLQAPIASAIPLGARLKLDSALLATATKEAGNASRR